MKLNRLFNEGWDEVGIEDPKIPATLTTKQMSVKIKHAIQDEFPYSYERLDIIHERPQRGAPKVLNCNITYTPFTTGSIRGFESGDDNELEELRNDAKRVIDYIAKITSDAGWHSIKPTDPGLVRFSTKHGFAAEDVEKQEMVMRIAPVGGSGMRMDDKVTNAKIKVEHFIRNLFEELYFTVSLIEKSVEDRSDNPLPGIVIQFNNADPKKMNDKDAIFKTLGHINRALETEFGWAIGPGHGPIDDGYRFYAGPKGK